MLCQCPKEGLTPECQKIIGAVEELTGIVSQQNCDANEVTMLMEKLHSSGASQKKIYDFFAARFLLGFGVSQEMNVEHEVTVLKRIGLPQERIQKLIASGERVGMFCKENQVPADHLIATFVIEGRSPAALVLSL